MSVMDLGMPMSPMAEFGPEGPSYRVTAHCPRHDQLRAGIKAYSRGQRPPSDAGTSVYSERSTLTTDAAQAYAAGPAATMSALGAVWRRQGMEFRKPHERPASCAPTPARPSTVASRSSSCGALPANDIKRRERRCDELLECLVRDGAADWGRTQEVQARLHDANLRLSRHSAMIRQQTQHVADSLRAEGIESMRSVGEQEPPSWPNPIANRVPPWYQSRYDMTFGLRDHKHLVNAKKFAKSVSGNERYRTLSSWGSDVGLVMPR